MNKKVIMSSLAFLLISGCASNASNPSVSTETTQEIAIEEAIHDGDKIVSSDLYLTATLENNEVTISFSDDINEYLGEIYEELPPSNTMFPIVGLTNEYQNVYAFCDGVWPSVFLLTTDGKVEGIPVGYQMNQVGDYGTYGIIPGLENIVSLEEIKVELEGYEDSYYETVIATDQDGNTYDVYERFYELLFPMETDGINSYALSTLEDDPQVKQYLNDGMSTMVQEVTEEINGEYCTLVAVGREEGNAFYREYYFAVGISGVIYQYDPVQGVWNPHNALARIVDGQPKDSLNLFAIVTEDNVGEYEELYANAYEIQLSIDEESSNTVILVPLFTGFDLSIYQLDYDATQSTLETGDLLYRYEYMMLGMSQIIHCTLAETIPNMRIVGTYEEIEVMWDAVMDGRNEDNGIYYLVGAVG